MIAKNYLNADEIRDLNRIVTMFLDVAEDRAARRRAMTMADWEAELDRFLKFNERPVLHDAGTISHDRMERVAAERYERYDSARQIADNEASNSEHDAELRAIEQLAISAPSTKRRKTGR